MLWRRLERPGHESSRLFFRQTRWHLVGTAVFAQDRQPCRLEYSVVCDFKWRTLYSRVAGWIGEDTIEIDLAVDSARRWSLNGTECPQVAGCIDLDLNFSPSANLLPIRRLGLAVGQNAAVQAAWLRFPSFTLERLDQVYHRIDDATYRYESAGGRFIVELKVNGAGFVTYYPHFWLEDFMLSVDEITLLTRMGERLLGVLIGGMCVILGYRLFTKLPDKTDSEGKLGGSVRPDDIRSTEQSENETDARTR